MDLYKLPKWWRNTKAQENTIDFLKPSELHITNCNNFEKFYNNTLIHVPKLYDLYNFQGITYTNDQSSAIPASAYEYDGTGYNFKYPIFGLRVERDVDPVVITGGTTPWEFLATVSIIHTRTNYKNLPDHFIKKSRVLSYLYTDNNSPMPSFIIDVSPYVPKTSTDFSYFYRWIKVTDGYILDFFAFWLYSLTKDVDPASPVKLKTNVYFLNKDIGNEQQPKSI